MKNNRVLFLCLSRAPRQCRLRSRPARQYAAQHSAPPAGPNLLTNQTAADFIKLTSKVGRDSFKRALTAIKKGGSGGHSAGPLFGRKLEDVTPEELMESVPLPVYRCVEFLSRTGTHARMSIYSTGNIKR